tara:strand:+ start:1632 stop:2807 length:1176 start_codon:yes stop_codon:yes gene_type:complete
MLDMESKFYNKTNFSDSDRYILEKDKMRESYIHDLILNNEDIQSDIFNILNINPKSNTELVHEHRYINGITADFTVLNENKIRAIMECKAGDIGVTDYVRGIGQVLQYEYFREENIDKGYSYSSNFNTVLVFPSSIIKNNLINIGRFKYPDTTIIIEINDTSNIPREIPVGDLKRIGEAIDGKLATISQYYIRDNRLFELYLLLKYLIFLELKGIKEIDRGHIEKNKLRILNCPNNRNWRNAFISLSSLGFINRSNIPTNSGKRMGTQSYEKFLLILYKSYIKPYIDTLTDYFKENEENLTKSNTEICKSLKSYFSNKEVLFLTQSKGRYLSSWLNIMRDDYGSLAFLPRSSKRILNYDLSELNDAAIIEKISNFTSANQYLNRFQKLVNE